MHDLCTYDVLVRTQEAVVYKGNGILISFMNMPLGIYRENVRMQQHSGSACSDVILGSWGRGMLDCRQHVMRRTYSKTLLCLRLLSVNKEKKVSWS